MTMDASMWTDVFLTVAGVLCGWGLLRREVPALANSTEALDAEARTPSDTPSIAAIIPARNEADNLPRLLASLSQQRTQPRYTLVVDDRSSDNTGNVAHDCGATVLLGAPPKPGWIGKSWACAQGADATHSDLLLFLDADLTLSVDAIAAMAMMQSRMGGLITVQPHHHVERPYEQLAAWCNAIVLLSVPPQLTSSSDWPIRRVPRGAFGPCLMCARADYVRIGGHHVVAREPLEHHALSEHFLRASLPVHNFRGGSMVQFRMYPHGFADLWAGFSKSMASGAGHTSAARLVPTVVWISGALTSFFWLLQALLSWSHVPGTPRTLVATAVVVLLYIANVAVSATAIRRAGDFSPWTAVLYPVPCLFFVAVFLRSLLHKTGRLPLLWKGRRLDR